MSKHTYILAIIVVLLCWLASYNQDQKETEIEKDISNSTPAEILEPDNKLEYAPVNASFSNKEIDCLARNIYFEAAVEPTIGKVAVAQVTLNRVKAKLWGNSVCKVVYAKKQFSWTSVSKRAWVHLDDKQWHLSKLIAQKVLNEGLRVHGLENAKFYHADYVNPGWKDKNSLVGKIGQHIFYEKAKIKDTKLAKL